MLDKIAELVKAKEHCVLATVSENHPHCSLMAYVVSPDLDIFHLISSRSTRKYHNILRNPHVSLLIDDREDFADRDLSRAKALTVTGVCRPMRQGRESDDIKKMFRTRHPHLDHFTRHPDYDVLTVEVDSYLLLDGVKESYFEKIGA
jgi:nitroimidazol reductase NimA-like FMN-containing flavoprotein (pyridoxamine 5'-phosphate oxidase superfamily)